MSRWTGAMSEGQVGVMQKGLCTYRKPRDQEGTGKSGRYMRIVPDVSYDVAHCLKSVCW